MIVHTHVVATLSLVSVVSGRSSFTLSQTTQMFTHLELGVGTDVTPFCPSFVSPELPVGHTSQVFLDPHRGQNLPKSTSTKIRNIYISLYFFYFFFLNVKPLLLLFQKNQGLPSVQALLADPKSRKHTHKLQPPVMYVSVCLQCECMAPR